MIEDTNAHLGIVAQINQAPVSAQLPVDGSNARVDC